MVAKKYVDIEKLKSKAIYSQKEVYIDFEMKKDGSLIPLSSSLRGCYNSNYDDKGVFANQILIYFHNGTFE